MCCFGHPYRRCKVAQHQELHACVKEVIKQGERPHLRVLSTLWPTQSLPELTLAEGAPCAAAALPPARAARAAAMPPAPPSAASPAAAALRGAAHMHQQQALQNLWEGQQLVRALEPPTPPEETILTAAQLRYGTCSNLSKKQLPVHPTKKLKPCLASTAHPAAD